MSFAELITSSFQGYADALIAKTPALIASLAVLALFVLLSGLLKLGARAVLSNRRVQLIVRLIQVTLLIVGTVLSLGILGLNLSGVVAGLGLLSVGISFTLQDLLVNFLAGLQLLGHSAFELGDIIEVNNIQGVVKFVGPRSVKLQSNSGVSIFVPNRDLLLKPVQVYPGAGGTSILYNIQAPLRLSSTLSEQVVQRLETVEGIAKGVTSVIFEHVTKDHVDVLIHTQLDKRHPPRHQVYSNGLAALANLMSQ